MAWWLFGREGLPGSKIARLKWQNLALIMVRQRFSSKWSQKSGKSNHGEETTPVDSELTSRCTHPVDSELDSKTPPSRYRVHHGHFPWNCTIAWLELLDQRFQGWVPDGVGFRSRNMSRPLRHLSVPNVFGPCVILAKHFDKIAPHKRNLSMWSNQVLHGFLMFFICFHKFFKTNYHP